MIVLVANAGERDLYYNVGDQNTPNFCHFELGKDDEKQVAQHLGCKNGARYISEAILQHLKQKPGEEAQRLRYPILKTVLDDGVFVSGKTIEKLLLVVTDQPAGTPEHHRCRDSLFTGQVLEQLIKKDYSGKIKAVEVVSYQENPANRERAYGFFGELLPPLAPDSQVQEFHASLSGGAPALNDSLQEQALRLYKAKCRFYEVIPPSEQESRAGAEKGTLQPVSAKPFLRDLAISIIEQLLNRYDYSGAREVLNMFSAVKFWDDEVEAVLQHAEQRINLNFTGAAKALQGRHSKAPFSKWHQAVSKANQLEQLVETYYIAQARYEHREYADFLWRIRLIYESIKDEVHVHLSDPAWKETGEASHSLEPLAGLAGKVLHPARGTGLRSLRGISKKTISDHFTPAPLVVKKHGASSDNDTLVIPTIKAIIDFLWAQKHKNPLPQNPYDQINNHLQEKLSG